MAVRPFEADVVLAGVVGSDLEGQLVRGLLEQAQIDSRLVVNDPQRPTTVKERFVGRASGCHPHQILRVDRERRDPIGAELERSMVERLQARLATADALLISDYGKGVCTPGILKTVIAAARQTDIPVSVDPCRNADYSAYAGASLLTPNRLEAEQPTGQVIREPQHALTVAYQLCETHSLDAVLVTLDRQGMVFCRADGTGQIVATKTRSVYDVTGAGDMVLATVGLGLAAGVPLAHSVRLAN